MLPIFQVLADRKLISFEDCDEVKSQYVNFLDVEVSRHHSSFSEFDPDETRVETFFHEHLHQRKDYQKLWDVMQTVLLLSHGQASVERGFSVNKQVGLSKIVWFVRG